jgi:lysophospholipase L1-like esterase
MKKIPTASQMLKLICCLMLPTLFFIGCGSVQKVSPSVSNTVLSIPDSSYPVESLKIEGHTPYTQKHYPERIAYFKKNPLKLHDVVFLGNSITEMGGDWGKRLGKSGIQNRGIGGDISAGVLLRLGEISFAKPNAVFLMIGINDINYSKLTPEDIASNIVEITKVIHRESSATMVFVQTILPTKEIKIRAKIAETNDWIMRKHQAKLFTIIDTHALFRDKEDLLKKQYTYDGIHLTEAGYAVWVKKLEAFFDR